MVYKIEKIEDSKLEKVYERSMEELSSFFQIDWKHIYRPSLILVPDRKTIDSLKRRKTEDWVVGWAYKDVYVLDFEQFGKESMRVYSEKEYVALIKHELAHYFSDIVSNYRHKPVWLLEGISSYLSGDNDFKEKPEVYKTFIDFFDERGGDVYAESGFAVAFLVKTYGKDKLLSLLSQSKKCESKQQFATLFQSIYGFELAYENFSIIE